MQRYCVIKCPVFLILLINPVQLLMVRQTQTFIYSATVLLSSSIAARPKDISAPGSGYDSCVVHFVLQV